MGRFLRLLHPLAAALMIVAVAMGYGVRFGVVDVGLHIPAAFAIAIVISFAHAMTIFYLAGIGVGMREAAGSRASCRGLLDEAATIRRRAALPLGLAIVSLMATTILGGGSHTRWLPLWVHESCALAALGLNVFAGWRAMRLVADQETLIRRMDALLAPGPRARATGS